MRPALIGASLIVTALFRSSPAAAQDTSGMIPKDGPITVTPDGKPIVTKALNNWVWTYTPTAK